MEINNEQNSGRKMSEAEKQSVIETLWFQWYFIRPKTAEGNITRRQPNITGIVYLRVQCQLMSLFFENFLCGD